MLSSAKISGQSIPGSLQTEVACSLDVTAVGHPRLTDGKPGLDSQTRGNSGLNRLKQYFGFVSFALLFLTNDFSWLCRMWIELSWTECGISEYYLFLCYIKSGEIRTGFGEIWTGHWGKKLCFAFLFFTYICLHLNLYIYLSYCYGVLFHVGLYTIDLCSALGCVSWGLCFFKML